MNTPAERPAEPAGALYYPTPVTPEEAFQAIGRLRKDARDEIDRLIRFLDDTDNHMELEPNGDELDASYPERGPHVVTNANEDDEDGADGEPSLGFLERHCSLYGAGRDQSGNQQAGVVCSGAGDDLEDEHDGAEPDECSEPSLGWTVDGIIGNQTFVVDGEQGGAA